MRNVTYHLSLKRALFANSELMFSASVEVLGE